MKTGYLVAHWNSRKSSISRLRTQISIQSAGRCTMSSSEAQINNRTYWTFINKCLSRSTKMLDIETPQIKGCTLKQPQWRHLSHLHQLSKRYSSSLEGLNSTPQAGQHTIHWRLGEAVIPKTMQKDTKSKSVTSRFQKLKNKIKIVTWSVP